LTKLLDSIRENIHHPHEIIVVDDQSEESLEAICSSYEVIYLRNVSPCGPAASRNRGAQHASGVFLVFFDADVICPRLFFETVLRVFTACPDVHALSFLSAPFSSDDSYMKNFGAVLEFHWFSRYFQSGEDMVTVKGVTTRNFAVRKHAFETIGGFDTRFKTNAIEDYDFGKRLADQFVCVLAREPVLYHNFPDSFWRVQRNYFVRAALWVPYYLRHKPALDPVQVSAKEARLRLVACYFVLAIIVAFWSSSLRWFSAGIALGLLLGYVWGIRSFLADAWKQSQKLSFVVFCGAVHFLSSFAIVAGGIWGLLRYLLGRFRILREG